MGYVLSVFLDFLPVLQTQKKELVFQIVALFWVESVHLYLLTTYGSD